MKAVATERQKHGKLTSNVINFISYAIICLQSHDLPHSKGILIFVLLADMLNTIIREIISLSAPSDSSQHAAGVATVVLFVLVVLLFFGILSTLNIIYVGCKGGDYMRFKIFVLLVEIFGAVLYFYGDNVGFIFDRYGSVLGCGPQCIENNRIAAIIALGFALMFYQLFPMCIRKIADYNQIEHTSTGWYSASDMMTTILKIDAVFTVVAIMAQTNDFCSRTDVSISVAFFIICLVVGISLMFVYCSVSALELSNNNNTEAWCWIAPLTFIMLVISFPMYVLADNLQPLDCAWECDSFASNDTLNDLMCNNVGNSALRLGFTLVAFLTVGTLSLVLFCCRHNTKGGATAKPI